MKRTPQKHPLPVAGTTNENSPGTDLRLRWMKWTPQKHPLPVAGMANENSPGTDLRPPALPSHPAAQPALWNPDTPCRLYKQARRSRVKQFSKRPHRDHFSKPQLPLHSKRPRRDYFSETLLHPKAWSNSSETGPLSYYSSHRPVEVLPPSHHTRLDLKEVLFPSLKTTATRCSITRSFTRTSTKSHLKKNK